MGENTRQRTSAVIMFCREPLAHQSRKTAPPRTILDLPITRHHLSITFEIIDFHFYLFTFALLFIDGGVG